MMKVGNRGCYTFYMNTLATFFASIIALFSGLFGHTTVTTQMQKAPVPITVTTTQQSATTSEITTSTSGNLQLKDQVIWSDEFNKYIVYNKGVFYNEKEIEDADSESFQIVTQNPFPVYKNSGENIAHYAKDKNKVYYDGEVMQGANVLDFEVIWASSVGIPGTEQVYAQDLENVYYKGKVLIPKADPKSFKQLGALSTNWRTVGNYSLDKNHIYYENKEVEGVDKLSFSSEYEDGYASDKSHVFLKGKIVPNVYPEKFNFPVHEP